MAPRFLAVFAFLQVMHYGFWCWFFPRRAASAASAAGAMGAGITSVRMPRGGRTVTAAVAAVFAIGFVTAWAGTKTSYVALASYHAYVEYAVLAALLVSMRRTAR
jgi:hypothetical protein